MLNVGINKRSRAPHLLVAEETGLRILEIPLLSEDGKDSPPEDLTFQKGEWYKAAIFNEKKFCTGFAEDSTYYLSTGASINGPLSWPTDFPCGFILFPTSEDSIEAATECMIEAIQQFYRELESRKFSNVRVKKAVKDFFVSRDNGDPLLHGAFAIGQFFSGCYRDKRGRIYDKNSLSIEILGYGPELILLLSIMVLKACRQRAVVVNSSCISRFYLVENAFRGRKGKQ